jgi:HSP20 family protein
MTFVNVKNRPANGHFNNFASDFFAPFPSIWKEDLLSARKEIVPVNIRETENAYEVDVVAPGFEKEEFAIGLENNLLTVSAERKREEDVKSGKFLRNEYKTTSFKRSFTVDDKIDAEAISAQYVNGVLALNLPKKASVKTTKQITIQ